MITFWYFLNVRITPIYIYIYIIIFKKSVHSEKIYQNFEIKPGIYILFVKFQNLSTPRQAPMLKTWPCYSLIPCQSIKKISLMRPVFKWLIFSFQWELLSQVPCMTLKWYLIWDPTSNELLHNPLFSMWGSKERPSNLCIIYWAKTKIRELLLLTPLDKPKVALKKSSWTNYIPNINNLLL